MVDDKRGTMSTYLSGTTTKSYLLDLAGYPLGHYPFINKRLLPEFKENIFFFARLRVVPHFSSGIVERGKRGRA